METNSNPRLLALLAYQTSLPLGPEGTSANDHRLKTCVLLMHGFSGSSAYFERNFSALSAEYWVVAPDMRGHGRSEHRRGGYHVARLAADLRDVITHLFRAYSVASGGLPSDVRFVPVGCSIGAAVLWTYVELFGDGDFAGFVFVDQAPLQDRSPFGDWDASCAHLGCYDEATMLAAQQTWIRDPSAAHAGLVANCLGYRFAPEPGDNVTAEQRERDERFFTEISALCDPEWLARLLADHTRYDHREAIEAITAPTLVMAGRRTGCFPLDGMRETVRRVEKDSAGVATMSIFDSGHWLFYEEPKRFNEEVIEFVGKCIRGLRGTV
ncbi:hypothetical protein DL770_000323 [Monosporascus sp. CRB-9-2]|nr:hypothetical protein DL770_000323 [Monosporascus sp. CRB-9-2]